MDTILDTVNIMYNGAHWKPLGIILCQTVHLPWRKLGTIKDVKRRIYIAKIASGDLHMHDMEEHSTDPTEEKTRTVNELRFRNTNLLQWRT